MVFEQVNIDALAQHHPFLSDEIYEKFNVKGICSCLYISTANVSENHKHNTSVLVPITPKIYSEVKEYLLKIKRGYEGETVQHDYVTYEWYDKFKIYLFPRRGPVAQGDTLLGVLKNVQHYQSKMDAPCFVGIITPRWRASRKALAKAAKRLFDHGATVEVITRSRCDIFSDGRSDLASEIYSILKCNYWLRLIYRIGRGKISALFYQKSEEEVNIHTKTLIISGPYRQGNSYTYQNNFWVGSPNLTGPAVNGQWESLLKVSQHNAFKHVKVNFEYLKKEAADLDKKYADCEARGI
jgi:hypothetical protein